MIGNPYARQLPPNAYEAMCIKGSRDLLRAMLNYYRRREADIAIAKLIEERKTQEDNKPMRVTKARNSWTDAENETFVSMYEAGATYNEIAERLDRTVAGVEKQRVKLKLMSPSQKRMLESQ